MQTRHSNCDYVTFLEVFFLSLGSRRRIRGRREEIAKHYKTKGSSGHNGQTNWFSNILCLKCVCFSALAWWLLLLLFICIPSALMLEWTLKTSTIVVKRQLIIHENNVARADDWMTGRIWCKYDRQNRHIDIFASWPFMYSIALFDYRITIIFIFGIVDTNTDSSSLQDIKSIRWYATVIVSNDSAGSCITLSITRKEIYISQTIFANSQTGLSWKLSN